MKRLNFRPEDVAKIAALANIPVSTSEERDMATGFNATMDVVDELVTVDVHNIPPTSQVTGLTNVFREDEVDTARTFTQDQALSNAKRTHNGFFVVDQILEE